MKMHTICFVLVTILAVSVIVDSKVPKRGGLRSKRRLQQTTNGNPKTADAVAKIDKIARFAIEEHNKKEHVHLQFVRVLSSREEVVAGKLYYVVLEARDGITVRKYEAKVLSMSWMNIKQLQAFKPV